MFYLCKFILSKETSETQTAIDQISNCLNDSFTSFTSLSDVFNSAVKPFFDLLKHNFINKDVKLWQIPPSKVYPIIQSSILVFIKNLSQFEATLCQSIKEKQVKIDTTKVMTSNTSLNFGFQSGQDFIKVGRRA